MSEAPPPYQAVPDPKEPQYGYQAQSTVVLQPQYTVVQQFRDVPCRIKCQYCGNDVVTKVNFETGTLTWIACFILFFVCPFCFWVPFCMDACQDAVHTCPNCHNIVGKYNRM